MLSSKKPTNIYKETPIGLLPKHWEVIDVCNVFEFLLTNSFSRENLTYEITENKIHNIHYGDIHSKFTSEILDCAMEELPFLKDELIGTQNFNFIQDGDLIIADASEDYEGVGECVEIKNVNNRKIVSGLHTFLARDFANKTAKGFRTYIFRSQKVNIELKKIATGISVFSISKTSLNKLKIPIPPLPEQKRIAQILSTWDASIDKLKGIIENLQLRNKGLAQVLLTGKKRLKGFEKTKWVEKKANKIFKSHTDKTHEGNLEILSSTQDRGVIPRSMSNYEIKYDESTLGTYKKVEVGDYVISLRSFQGGIEFSEYLGIVSPAYTILKEIIPISKTFYKVYFKTETFINRLNSIIYGIRDGKQISFGDFATLNLPCPSVEEQDEIGYRLLASNNELNHYQQKLIQLQTQKKGIMQQLLTGKVLTVKQ
jgi:type I restriction enzyme, S subunit